MKTEIEVQVEATPAHTIKKTVTVCDLCGENLPAQARFGYNGSCSSCKRDICRACSDYDTNDVGDYPDCYCSRCHGLKFGTYRHLYDKADNERYEAIDALDKRVREESLQESDAT